MSAETLRKAAALMRGRAEEPVAQPERWPNVVAPAVAGWLESVADAATSPDEKPGAGRSIHAADEDHALTVARAYLGESA